MSAANKLIDGQPNPDWPGNRSTEIEKIYSAAMTGSDTPDIAWVSCEECGQSFVLPSEIPCEHLRAKLEAA